MNFHRNRAFRELPIGTRVLTGRAQTFTDVLRGEGSR